MIFRRAAGIGLAAVLAAGPMLVLSTVPAAAAAAAKPGYVAVVISGHGAHCVKWKSGITGDTVLNDVATVAYRSDGLIVTIDGDPSSGTADDSHFWSYWHDTKGTWSYSNFGASSYNPPAGSVEGWSYDNGKSSAPKPANNPSGLYAKLCGAKDKKKSGGGTVYIPVPSTASEQTRTVAPAPKRTHVSASHGSAAPQNTQSGRPTHTSTAPSASASTSSGSTSTSAGPSRSAAGPNDTRTTVSGAVVGSPRSSASSGPSPSSAPGTIDASPSASSSSSGSPVGLLIGIGLVVVLGAGAGAVALRRRGV